jgi:hypothetical protein
MPEADATKLYETNTFHYLLQYMRHLDFNGLRKVADFALLGLKEFVWILQLLQYVIYRDELQRREHSANIHQLFAKSRHSRRSDFGQGPDHQERIERETITHDVGRCTL